MQALVTLGLWSLTVHANAESALGERPSAQVRAAPAASEPHRARIMLVGELARDLELVALLRELLGAAGVEPEFEDTDHFDPDSLFADGGRNRAMLVFVSLRTPRDARLHFRAPSGDRFLLRKVELPSGIDAVGRELLGQVIKSSVAVLLHSSDGLSRAEASAALASDAAPPERSEPPATPPARRAAPRHELAPKLEPARGPIAAEPRWAFGAGLGYSLEWASADLPAAHGPGVVLGVRSTAVPQLGLKLGVERLFAQQLRTSIVGGEVQRTDAQLLFELGIPLARTQVGFLALGPGLEISRLTPASGAAGVTVAPPKTDMAPALRAAASYELAFGRLVLGAAAFVTLSLADTHYDVIDSGVRRRFATVGAVRPGSALSLSYWP